MKKKLVLLAAAVFALSSCGNLSTNSNQGGDDSGVNVPPGNTGSPIEKLEPSAQKKKLEDVAEALMDEYPASEFEEFFELTSKFSEKYLDGTYDDYGTYYGYDWDEFYEYCEEKGEEMFFFKDEETKKNGETCYKWTVEGFLEFSQFNGMLILGENGATCQDYDGTRMVFTLDGNEYQADIKASGNGVKAVYTYEDIYGSENWDGYYDEETGYWVDNYVFVHYEDTYHFEVIVPEKITATVKKNGADYASVEITFTRRFNESGVSLTTDCFMVTCSVTIDGHTVVIEKTGYDAATGKAGVSYTLKKGAEVIISAAATADVKVKLVTEEDEWGNGYDDYMYPEFTLAKNFDVYVDILGQLQIIGKCTDGIALAENIENVFDADTESQAERAVDNVNNYADLGIYYDKSVTRQADVIMDYRAVVDDYNDYTWYDIEPIIKVPDGSKYAFYEYFDEDSFAGLSNSFDLWLSLYETMLEHYFE